MRLEQKGGLTKECLKTPSKWHGEIKVSGPNRRALRSYLSGLLMRFNKRQLREYGKRKVAHKVVWRKWAFAATAVSGIVVGSASEFITPWFAKVIILAVGNGDRQ